MLEFVIIDSFDKSFRYSRTNVMSDRESIMLDLGIDDFGGGGGC